MKNPCLPLKAPYEGLSVDRTEGAYSIVIKQTLSNPLALPDDGLVNIRLLPGACAHMLGANATINLVLEEGAEAFWYSFCAPKLDLVAQVGPKARLAIAQINLNDAAESSMRIELKAPDAQVSFVGLDQISGRALSSTRLHIIHETPYTVSTQAFRGIYAGESQGSFQGKVTVAPHAERSSVQQLYKSVLLSDKARAFVKPELEIDNFDISASHGASIGQLDPEALFYLCSRGLSQNVARQLLVKSMTADILQAITHQPMRDYMSHQVELALEDLR